MSEVAHIPYLVQLLILNPGARRFNRCAPCPRPRAAPRSRRPHASRTTAHASCARRPALRTLLRKITEVKTGERGPTDGGIFGWCRSS